jgi:DNA-binding transcriptional ArsR family regulator
MKSYPASLDTGQEAVAALAALAQEHRLAVFRLLVEFEPDGLAAGEIANRLGLVPSSLSFHLAHLERAGLVAKTRHGRLIVYRAGLGRVRALASYLLDNCCGGQTCAAGPSSNQYQRRKAQA